MKISGAVLILIACLSAGFGCCQAWQRKIACLSELCRALSLLKAELATKLLPLSQLFELIGSRSKGNCSLFFSLLSSSLNEIDRDDFSSLWEKSAVSCFNNLSDDGLNAFSSLGSVLGKFQLDQQLSALDSVIDVMERSLESERLAFPAKKRLSLGLSTAGAVLILIVLM